MPPSQHPSYYHPQQATPSPSSLQSPYYPPPPPPSPPRQSQLSLSRHRVGHSSSDIVALQPNNGGNVLYHGAGRGRGSTRGRTLQHPDVTSTGNTYDVVFHLSQETAAFYLDVLERGGHGATTATARFSPITINMATYLSQNCILGCQRITELNYDVHSLFTPGLRPEIRQDFRMLFACLNDQLLSNTYRARQQFICVQEADRYRYSLFVFISEVWRPGCMSVSLLCDSSMHADGDVLDSGGISGRAPRGVLSTLLNLAQSAVMDLREDYRQRMTAARFRTTSSFLHVGHNSLLNFQPRSPGALTTHHKNNDIARVSLVEAKVKSIKDALEKQKLATSSSTAWSTASRVRKERNWGNSSSSVPGSGGSITLDYLPSNDEMVLALQRDTLAHYRALLLSAQDSQSRPYSALTFHVLQYMASSAYSLGGFKQIFELRNDVGVLFTPGTRPEIKKDFRVLFGWHMDELLNPSYRCRQQFTVESHADLYRRALFVYITELWKPHSVDESVLRSAYIHVRSDTLYNKSTGVLSMSLLKLQDVVLELRGHMEIVAFPARRGATGSSSAVQSAPIAGQAMYPSSQHPPPAVKKQKLYSDETSQGSACQVPMSGGGTHYLTPSADSSMVESAPPRSSYSNAAARPSTTITVDATSSRAYLENTLAFYENVERASSETQGVLQYVRAVLSAELAANANDSWTGESHDSVSTDNCSALLADLRRSRGACLFDTSSAAKYYVLLGWFQVPQTQQGVDAREHIFHSLSQPQGLTFDFKFSLYVYILELWEPKSMSLHTLQQAYCTRVGTACGEQKGVSDVLCELQEVILDLRADLASSAKMSWKISP